MSQDNEPYCNHDAIAVTNGMCECGEQVGPIAVTLALTGLPDACPHCGAPAPDGEWGIGVHGRLLHVICARCFTAITPVRAVAAP
jgi:hypothetical protein